MHTRVLKITCWFWFVWPLPNLAHFQQVYLACLRCKDWKKNKQVFHVMALIAVSPYLAPSLQLNSALPSCYTLRCCFPVFSALTHQEVCTVRAHWIATLVASQNLRYHIKEWSKGQHQVFSIMKIKCNFQKLGKYCEFTVLFTCCHDFQVEIVFFNKVHLR